MATKRGAPLHVILATSVSKTEIRDLLFSDNSAAHAYFARTFSADIRKIIIELTEAFNAYQQLSAATDMTERSSTVLLFAHAAFNAVLTSTHLLVSGLPTPSGNAMRQFAEASAMAMLCADCSNNVFDIYSANTTLYPVHKSLDLVMSGKIAPSLQKLLRMNKAKFRVFAEQMRLFDHHSHASALSLSYLMMFTKSGGLIVGSQVDPAKRAQYKAELSHRRRAAVMVGQLIEALSPTLRRKLAH